MGLPMNKLETAFQKFKNAHYLAVKRDIEAEYKEDWNGKFLKKCNEAWALSNQLEKEFLELLKNEYFYEDIK